MMKRLWGILLLVCIITPASAMSPEGKVLLEQIRAKCRLARQSPPPAVAPRVEQQENNSQSNDVAPLGQIENMVPPIGLDVLPGNFSDLNAADPTIAYEDGGKLVLGAPKKHKGSKSSKKAHKKGKSKIKGKAKNNHMSKNNGKSNGKSKSKSAAKPITKTKGKAKVASKKAN